MGIKALEENRGKYAYAYGTGDDLFNGVVMMSMKEWMINEKKWMNDKQQLE